MSDKKNTYCNCLYYSANALARIITKKAEEAFSVVNLAPSYAFVVMTVNKNPGLQAGELAGIMMLTPSTVTRLLEKLEIQELVKRHTEGRLTLIYPTAKSVEINKKIEAAWFSLYQNYINILGEDMANQLTENIYTTALKLEKA
ncbi:MAG: MarR family winged helix-turn-helix transcriptional regulator [Bacteroidales bacterium]